MDAARKSQAPGHDSAGPEDPARDRKLEESEERYRTLVENLDDVVFSLDAEGRFTFLSSAIAHYGFTPEQLLGRAMGEIIHPEDAGANLPLWDDLRAGRRTTAEVRMIDRSGRIRFVRGSARPLVAEGKLAGVLGVLVDLTQQRETEAQLHLAQKMEAVGRLAGGVAHDFNNLLTVIIAYAEMARDAMPEDSPWRADLTEVVHAGRRGTELTRQLLAFSRKQVRRTQVLDLNALLSGVEKMLQRLIGEDVELIVVRGAGLAPTRADAGQLEQVLMNLAVNARDAMPTGGALRIATENAEVDEEYAAAHPGVKAGSWVKISASDTGTGMDEATLARIFEPFFTTKAPGKGTGLGLATVYGIVAQSGGCIGVWSRPGEGTTFDVFLPREAAAVRPLLPSLAPGAASRPRRRVERILVVEDDIPVRNLVERVLVDAGYAVLSAEDGAQAVQACVTGAEQVHILVTDVVMPGLGGPDLWERLKRLWPELKVLYLSGYSHDVSFERSGLPAEAVLLSKPFDAVALLRAVRGVLEGP